jgi:hypothetical protein
VKLVLPVTVLADIVILKFSILAMLPTLQAMQQAGMVIWHSAADGLDHMMAMDGDVMLVMVHHAESDRRVYSVRRISEMYYNGRAQLNELFFRIERGVYVRRRKKRKS